MCAWCLLWSLATRIKWPEGGNRRRGHGAVNTMMLPASASTSVSRLDRGSQLRVAVPRTSPTAFPAQYARYRVAPPVLSVVTPTAQTSNMPFCRFVECLHANRRLHVHFASRHETMSASGERFDVVWRDGALGLRFTPNERDEPVVCQVPAASNAAVLASPAAVGDVLEAFALSSDSSDEIDTDAFQPVAGFDALVGVLQRAALPIALRFRSRERDLPEPAAASPRRQYAFEWAAGAPLGLSLAMDPCSLHAAITSVDPRKLAPALAALHPAVGDVLVAIGDAQRRVALDRLRFEDVIQTLRDFGRPCTLRFARMEPGSDEEDEDEQAPLPCGTAALERRPLHRLVPMAQRQSFRIDKPVVPTKITTTATASTGPSINEDKKSDFYSVIYGGGAVGLHLRDCSRDSRRNSSGDRSNRTNGYAVAVKEVTDARSAAGLELAAEGDLLMAIGQRDLQHVPFDQVRAELGHIQSPTPLLFKKRRRSSAAGTSTSLVDTLLLFLV